MSSGELDGLSFCFTTYYWTPYRSGLTLVVTRVARELAARGARVTAVVARHDRRLPRKESVEGVDVRRANVVAGLDRGVVAPSLIPAFRAAARDSDVALIVLPMAEAGAMAATLPSGTHLCVQHVCDPQAHPSSLGRLLIPAVDASARAALKRADLILTLSADYARSSRVLGAFAERVLALPPPVAHEGLEPSELGVELREAARRPRIGFLGRLTHEKGLSQLIRAAAGLVPRPTVILAGPSADVAGGGEAESLRGLAQELGVEVEFPGPLSDGDVPKFLSSLDVFALPSLNSLEAWGMVQAEAMLCGTPVVASALPGVREVIQRTGMGVLVTPGDIASLRRGLQAVLEDRERYLRPRESVVSELALDRTLPEHVAALRRLAMGFDSQPEA